MHITWKEDEVEKLIQFAKESFTKNDRINLEIYVRNGIGLRNPSDNCQKQSDKSFNDHFNSYKGDIVGQYLDELWSSRSQICLFLEDVIESASLSYRNIINKGLKEGLTLSSKEDHKIAHLSWKQSLMKMLKRHIIFKLRKDFYKQTSQGCFFSIGNEYNNFEPETIRALMNEGFTVVDSFIGPEGLNSYDELEFLEYNGIFTKIDKSTHSYHEDCYVLWLKSSYLDQIKHKSTSSIFEKLSQIPYELTHKCNILLQVFNSVCVTYMEPNKSKILKHIDGKEDGVKFTIFYVPKSASGSSIKLYLNESTHNIHLKSDQLILLRSHIEYEIQKVEEKLFFFTSWITGPD